MTRSKTSMNDEIFKWVERFCGLCDQKQVLDLGMREIIDTYKGCGK